MGILFKYEIKKILKRRSTWVAFFVLFSVQIFMSVAGNLGTTETSTGQLVETHAERNRIDRKNSVALSGTPIDNNLIEKVQAAYAKLDGMDQDEYLLSEVYQNEVRRYDDIYYRLTKWTNRDGVGGLTADALYADRKTFIEKQWDRYKLSEKEQNYWEKQEEKLSKPFDYQYAVAYEYICKNLYTTCLILTFFIAICMVTVFMEEHSQKTDQLLLCTRFGKGKLYAAKILAGSIVALVVALIFVVTLWVGNLWCFGTEGFDAPLQISTAFFSSVNMTTGQVAIALTGIVFAAVLLTGLFAMVLSEIMKNSIGAMAIIIGTAFASRLIPALPVSFGILSRLWNMWPLNILMLSQGFLDVRLTTIGGICLTAWQSALFLYVLLGAGAVLLGKKAYCR